MDEEFKQCTEIPILRNRTIKKNFNHIKIGSFDYNCLKIPSYQYATEIEFFQFNENWLIWLNRTTPDLTIQKYLICEGDNFYTSNLREINYNDFIFLERKREEAIMDEADITLLKLFKPVEKYEVLEECLLPDEYSHNNTTKRHRRISKTRVTIYISIAVSLILYFSIMTTILKPKKIKDQKIFNDQEKIEFYEITPQLKD